MSQSSRRGVATVSLARGSAGQRPKGRKKEGGQPVASRQVHSGMAHAGGPVTCGRVQRDCPLLRSTLR
jgi:hypothetical protein